MGGSGTISTKGKLDNIVSQILHDIFTDTVYQ